MQYFEFLKTPNVLWKLLFYSKYDCFTLELRSYIRWRLFTLLVLLKFMIIQHYECKHFRRIHSWLTRLTIWCGFLPPPHTLIFLNSFFCSELKKGRVCFKLLFRESIWGWKTQLPRLSSLSHMLGTLFLF